MSVRRYTAFTRDASGGNPAGVWIGDHLPEPSVMQAIAAEVGFSETIFIAPAQGRERQVRYYSPKAEVSFCGHATIAGGVVLGYEQTPGEYHFITAVGRVVVKVEETADGMMASLTSVAPQQRAVSDGLLDESLQCLRWQRDQLDPKLPPIFAYAGAWHLVLAVSEAVTLAALDYDFDRLNDLMQTHQLTTLQLIWRESQTLYHSRNPFPVGGVIEDPATGAAAAALGGYLRDAGLIKTPSRITIKQGVAMGRPSRLLVDIPRQGGITVSGLAVPMDDND
ncbi:MAG: PhzF family phenazine biosynthesis isomerase [Wenzhouxiangellaceae bacterium]